MYCVIPAAGRGVRFNELGKNYPKCVLPYQEVPIIVHNIRLAFDKGAREVCIVVGHQGNKIHEIVGMYFPDDPRIRFAEYQEAAGKDGPGVSIYRGIPDNIGEEPILILLSDIVVKEFSVSEDYISWISTQVVSDWERWCMAEVDRRGDIIAFHDKPKEKPPTEKAVSGIYYFRNAEWFRNCLIDAIHGTREGEVQISSAMARYMKRERIRSDYIDIIDFGTLEEYLQNRGVKNSRSFNKLIEGESGATITKTSNINAAKIHAEVNWYENLPVKIKVMTPRIFDKYLYGSHGMCPAYTMERIESPTLRELYLYLESDPLFWSEVYTKLFNITNEFKYFSLPGKSTFFNQISKKTADRFAEIKNSFTNIDDVSFLNEFLS